MIPITTFSIVAYDPARQEWGAAVAGNWVPRTDTLLAVYEPKIDPPYDTITGTLLCESDDVDTATRDLGSACCITATTRGWYWVQVKPYNPYLDAWKYDLS